MLQGAKCLVQKVIQEVIPSPFAPETVFPQRTPDRGPVASFLCLLEILQQLLALTDPLGVRGGGGFDLARLC